MSRLGHTVRFPAVEAPVIGALDFTPGSYGVFPRRLPAWTRRQITDPVFDFVVEMTSGVRIVTVTDSDSIELEIAVLGIDPGTVRPPAAPLDLLVDGTLHTSVALPPDEQSLISADGVIRQRRAPARVRFDGLGTDRKSIELWLPHTASTELVALRSTRPLHPPHDGRPVWLHHGSSISQCGEADAPTGTWPAVAALRAGVSLRSFGFSGNAVGDPFVARTIRDQPADLISLEIGINVVNGDHMRRRMFESVLHGFLDTVRDGHPLTPILLIGPIPSPALETMPGPSALDPITGMCRSDGDRRELNRGSMSLDVVRAAIAQVLTARQDDPHLGYLDGHLLLPPNEVEDLKDNLHPNAAAYLRMGERFADLAFAEHGLLSPVPGSGQTE